MHTAVAVLFASSAAADQASQPDWSSAASGTVAEVLSGDSVALVDGRVLKLAAIRVPRAPLNYDDRAPWRREREAQEMLRSRLDPGDEIEFITQEPSHDRHRRLLVQARGPGGLWLQRDLLEQGHVLLDLNPPRHLAQALRQAETAARHARRGLWRDRAHATVPAAEAERVIGRFAVVEGRVHAVDVVHGTGYLNFDEDWRSDFTVRLSSGARRVFAAAEQPIEDYAGATIRVRGWVFYSGGPMIEARYPGQVERLEQ